METSQRAGSVWVLADDGRLYRDPVWGGSCLGLGFVACVSAAERLAMFEAAEALGPAPDGAWPSWDKLGVDLAVEAPGPARAYDVGRAARELLAELFGPSALLYACPRRLYSPDAGCDFMHFSVVLRGPPPASAMPGTLGVARVPWGRPHLVVDFGRAWG